MRNKILKFLYMVSIIGIISGVLLLEKRPLESITISTLSAAYALVFEYANDMT